MMFDPPSPAPGWKHKHPRLISLAGLILLGILISPCILAFLPFEWLIGVLLLEALIGIPIFTICIFIGG